MDAGAAVLEPSNSGRVIDVHRVACLLHVVHRSVNGGMENVFCMGPVGEESWHERPKQHLVGLLGSLWYNMSRSDISST